jgi:two-component system cell cycle response regulator
MQSNSHLNKPKTLIVGNIADAFDDPKISDKLNFSVCSSIGDAIETVTAKSYDRILIVMSTFAKKLRSDLSNLRNASRSAKIILLAKMLEEPDAIGLTKSSNGAKPLADDYFICPADADLLEAKPQAITSTTPVGTVTAIEQHKNTRITELEKLATEDDLTDLKNRRYVFEFLNQVIAKAKKEDMRVTLFVFDIDNFKHYNDVYGHAIGDSVLKQAASMMKKCCREHDIVGRIGGDEFAVIFWDCPTGFGTEKLSQKMLDERRKASEHPQEVLFICERFRKEISSAEFSFLGPDGKGELTISGGLASFPKDGLGVEELFEQADKAMLEAKRSGKNRIDLIGPSNAK